MRKEETIPVELVRKELHSILHFGEIANSAVLSQFLEFVMEKKLAGQEDEIKEYTIGVKGLGKPADFNPQLDASVRIHAGRLRRVIERYYQGPGKNDTVLIDIPKGSYIPVFQFRKAPEPPGHPELQEEAIPFTTRHPSNGNNKPVLAVLPFHNLSSENSKDFFVSGIGEQMSTDLARFQNISVISYYSTYKYDPALKDLQEMKNTINIDYVLTGSVRFVNDTVRLNVQLILTENGSIVFTENYSRHLTPENIFDIQEEIVNEVLNVIADDAGIIVMNKAHASPLNKTENLSVQEAIYKYFDFLSDLDAEKFQPAVFALEKAVSTEPDNALACALLSGLYMDTYLTKRDQDGWILQKAEELALNAIRSDPQSQHAQKAIAWMLLLSGKKEKSLEAIEKCIKLNPKASSIIATMGLAYICQGEYTQGFKWLLETVHLNPIVHGSTKFAFAVYYFQTKQYEESLKWLERLTPLETPFLTLLRLSLSGKIHRSKNGNIPPEMLDLEEQADNIISRIIFEPGLKKEILNGLKLAGLTVK